jgi:hypothetical protein
LEKIAKRIIILTPIASREDKQLAEENHKILRHTFPYLTSTGLPIDSSRNYLVKQAMDIGADSVLFLDADIEPPGNIFRLFRRKEKILSGIYWRFHEPIVPLAFTVKDGEYIPVSLQKKKGLIEVDAVGMGCCMINTSVFGDIEYPWFKFIFDSYTSISEDFYFCLKVREKYKIFVDPRVECAHIGLFRFYNPKKFIPFC